jgi:ABC-2 type transport system ATP-binding protein
VSVFPTVGSNPTLSATILLLTAHFLDQRGRFDISYTTIVTPESESIEPPAVEVKNLSFSYHNTKALDSLTLQVPRGTKFGLLGPNGAGKTTLIRLLVGLLKPKSGRILVMGEAPSRRTAYHIGYMPQLPSLYIELSVEQNIDFFARIYGLRGRERRSQRVDEVIKLVDLWPKRKARIMELSGGMKQRVSLGCAIVHQPPLAFLDEPTVGLDPELRVHLWDYFEYLTQKGSTLVISSHTMDDAAHCQQLAFLRQGRVIALGSPAELRSATGKAGATLEDAFLYFIKRDEEKSNVD